jgi:hypothetical protein
MGYTMEDFKAGKIAVWAETKGEAERFVSAFKSAGIDWMGGAPRLTNNMSFVCGWEDNKGVGYASSKDYAAKNTNDGKPYKPVTVAEFFAPAYLRDQLFIFRTADGITAVQKQDGKEVKRATVKRYHKDADDFLTGAAAALDKLRGEQKPVKYKVGDVVRVRSDLVANTRYGVLTMWAGPMYDQLIGKNVKLSGHSRKTIWDAENGWFVDEAMFSHLVRRAHD